MGTFRYAARPKIGYSNPHLPDRCGWREKEYQGSQATLRQIASRATTHSARLIPSSTASA